MNVSNSEGSNPSAGSRNKKPSSASKERWNREYSDKKAIPSSDRDRPSRALLAAQSEIDLQSVDTAIDIGCGNGRNAVFLAEHGIDVCALDFSENAVRRTKERIEKSSFSGTVSIFVDDVTEGLPFVNDAVDLIVDSYLSCHFFQEPVLESYFAEIRRVLDPSGKFYWAGLGESDEYYQSILQSHPAERTIVDPLNGIPKRLYDHRMLDVQLPFGNTPELATELIFEDMVAGDSYQRSIVSAVFENNAPRE